MNISIAHYLLPIGISLLLVVLGIIKKRTKLWQLGSVLSVFFIFMSMTGKYHHLIVVRDDFAKSVANGSIPSSVSFSKSINWIMQGQLPPQLIRIPELSFGNPTLSLSPIYILATILIVFALLLKNRFRGIDNNRYQISSKLLIGVTVGLFFLPTLISWLLGGPTNHTFWEIPKIINNFSENLMYHWFPVQIYDPDIDDYDQSTLIKEITRAFSGVLLFLIDFVREVLIGGVKTIVAFTSWDWLRDHPWAHWPALPWTVITSGAFILGYRLKGIGLSMLAGLGCFYLLIFGQWEPAMQTLSLVLVAAPISGICGVICGVLAFKFRQVEKVLMPLLNIAQTMPHFSYLVPVAVFFGVGDHAGAIATIIFATPPMIRLTLLGLKKVPTEVVEAGMMSGCKNHQLLFKVLIPTARHDILIGVNQVIMQCLAMAVIASLIGARGLGFNLLLALNQLRIGQALELGVAIVVIAVVLDRLSLAWANKPKDYFSELSLIQRHQSTLLFIGITFIACLLAWLGHFLFPKEGVNYFYFIPHDKGITTASFWQTGVDYMVHNWATDIKLFNKWLLQDILMPLKVSFLAMPVIATFTLFMGISYLIGGWRSALVVGGFLLFMALSQWWERALITMYMVFFAVTVSVIMGTVIGALCSRHQMATKVGLLVCDTFQTFPSFIYLIPVIMLFGIDDTAVLIAVIVYAIIPPIRYTIEGLRSVPQSLIDAGKMSGATRSQILFNIKFPLAFPHIMLGVNQCVTFALFMVIIGAFIGTDDLGQFILKALSDKHGIGNGLVLGMMVAFIGLSVDHLINVWAKKRKRDLGMSA